MSTEYFEGLYKSPLRKDYNVTEQCLCNGSASANVSSCPPVLANAEQGSVSRPSECRPAETAPPAPGPSHHHSALSFTLTRFLKSRLMHFNRTLFITCVNGRCISLGIKASCRTEQARV